jgi:hypothetical protein
MKKSILILGAALALAVIGCDKEQGGTSDQSSTDRSSMSNVPSSQGNTANPEASSLGTISNETSTNTSTNTPPPSATPPNP